RQKKVPRSVTYGGPDESQTRTKAPQLSHGSADRATGSGGFPNVVLGGRTPGAAARAARAPLSRPGGLRDVFSAPARASDLTRTQDRSPAAVEVVGDKSFPLVRQRSRRSLTGSKAALGGKSPPPSRSSSGAV